MNPQYLFLFFAALSGFIAVALGAFGAHGLQNILHPDQKEVWQTAVRYQMWHALALGIIATLLNQHTDNTSLIKAGWLMVIGSFCFSGSLYALCLSEQKWFGPVTPIGGALLLMGWFLLLIFAFKQTRHA